MTTRTTNTRTSTLEQFWEQLAASLPEFSVDDQRAAVTLYRELAKGDPVSADQLGDALGLSAGAARAILERPPIQSFVFPDDEGRVVGFGGLATAPMTHRFEVDGRELWTWCAWDSLFLPEILEAEARVTSPDPETGEHVTLVVSPQRIESIEPAATMVSFPVPEPSQFNDSAANVMGNFCHFVFFFVSPESGARWTARHDGTFLYSIDEAFELALRHNARNFGAELERRR